MKSIFVRDSHGEDNGKFYGGRLECKSGAVDIVSDDGRTLFSVSTHNCETGQVEIRCAGFCNHERTFFTDKITIEPRAGNCFYVRRVPWKNADKNSAAEPGKE